MCVCERNSSWSSCVRDVSVTCESLMSLEYTCLSVSEMDDVKVLEYMCVCLSVTCDSVMDVKPICREAFKTFFTSGPKRQLPNACTFKSKVI